MRARTMAHRCLIVGLACAQVIACAARGPLTRRASLRSGSVGLPSACRVVPGIGDDSDVGSILCRGRPKISYDIGPMAGDHCGGNPSARWTGGERGAGCHVCSNPHAQARVTVYCPWANFFMTTRNADDRAFLMSIANSWLLEQS